MVKNLERKEIHTKRQKVHSHWYGRSAKGGPRHQMGLSGGWDGSTTKLVKLVTRGAMLKYKSPNRLLHKNGDAKAEMESRIQ